MSKKKSRRGFPGYDQPRMPAAQERYLADESSGGVFGFFRDFGTRETIESIFIAIILALMFRAFEAEAFMIPTGSMAPSLQGRHIDLACENCSYRFRTGASEDSTEGGKRPARMAETYCPICQFKNKLRPEKVADHVSNNGDRILVNKFIYDFSEPQRYDVIVFKNPNKGNQNYIKRLIGLPGDNILIENGDIYLMTRDDNGEWSREISRKPPHKLHHVLQTVDDTHFIGKHLQRVNWPLRWQQYRKGANGDGWETIVTDGKPNYLSKSTTEPNWLRYRHFRPLKQDWRIILDDESLPNRFQNGRLPAGRLIGDHYAYNDGVYEGQGGAELRDLGLHWVGDIGIECWAEVESTSGALLFDLVEGGVHFTCRVDVATGVATLETDSDSVQFRNADGKVIDKPIASTTIKKPGSYRIEYINADDRLHLWIDGSLVNFDAASYTRDGIPIPQWSEEDAGDAEPAGVAAENCVVRIKRLKILRDLYYTSVRDETKWIISNLLPNLGDETEETDILFILELYAQPERWSSPEAVKFFNRKKNEMKPMFELQVGNTRDEGQFLPMGDNSPASLDGRVWDGPKYVERDLLIGRALFVYWPHTLNEPIPFFPNFSEMGFIR